MKFDVKNRRIIESFSSSGVNLTAESDQGQIDAYVKNAEWDLEGSKKILLTKRSFSSFINCRILK